MLELEEKTAVILRMSEQQQEMAEKVSASVNVALAAGKAVEAKDDQIRHWKAEITRQNKQAVTDEQVDRVIAHWMQHRPRTNPESFSEGGTRRKMIVKALELMRKAEIGPVAAVCEAIDGLHLAPYRHYSKRVAVAGPGRELENKIEHAIGDEIRIERCREIAQKAKLNGEAALWTAYETACSVENEWARRLLDKLEGRPNGNGGNA